ncbi:MAG: sensor histidine kinase [Flavobacteriales bacterium]|nr:sensor histidine kinase [Flavobacteriales bacterium]
MLRKGLMLFVFSLLAACCPVAGLAQNADLDSMLQLYRSQQITPKLLNDLCWAYVFNGPDTALFYGRQALALSREQGNTGNEATAFNRMGVAFDVKHMPDSALLFYHQAVALSEKDGEKATTAGALNNIGLIHWNLGELDKAVEYYVRSAELFEQIGNNKGLANTYNNIGLVLWDDGNLQEAMAYTFKALRINEKLKDTYGIAANYTNIGLIHEDLKQLDSTVHYLLLSIPLKEQLKDAFGLAKSFHNLGFAYERLKRYDEAESCYRKAIVQSEIVGNDRAMASTLMHLAGVLRHRGDMKASLDMLDRSEALCKREKDGKLLYKIFEQQAHTRYAMGHYQQAAQLFRLSSTVKDSVVTIEKSEALEELQTKYSSAVKDRKIEEQERQVAEASVLAERRNTYIALLGSLLIILLLFGAVYFQFTRRKAEQMRNAAIIRERELGLRAIISATEEERKRIAKDLHDGVVQGLTGLKMRFQNQLRNADMNAVEKENFVRTSSMLDESINELRNISHQMMPRALGELGLLPALEDLLDKAFGHTDIRFSFEHHRLDGQRFNEAVEVSLYRITQELINNIIKHSGAKAVSVQLLRTATHLVLVVEDNGKGFNYEDKANRNGIGLMNISSRAKALNGEVDYAPSPQQGTVATIRIPIA